MDLKCPTLIPILAAALVCLAGIGGRAQRPAQDQGAAGAWQKIRKLQTTASAMHTTAHPDDEQGGMLAFLSRGQGARVSLLTLTRGESGDNAIGPELFDALGLIRTEELLVADRYYGVDNQYFTSVADYGFSKRLDEALEKWGRDTSFATSFASSGWIARWSSSRGSRATLATATATTKLRVSSRRTRSGWRGIRWRFPTS